MPGLSLKVAAQRFQDETYDLWDSGLDDFVGTMVGRLFRVDRFKTIYHRPTRRQKMTVKDMGSLPDSMVIRRQLDGEVFIVCDTNEREFWAGQNYDNVITVNRVAGKGSLVKARVLGSGDDLGAVNLNLEIPTYLDFELRTATDEPGTQDIFIGNYIAVFSKNAADARPGDYFKLGDDTYRVDLLYVDSGFQHARVVKEPFSYVTANYKLHTGGRAYDPSTSTYNTGAAVDRAVSIIIPNIKKEQDAERDYRQVVDAFIYKRHIGFRPKLQDELQVDGDTYEIVEVTEFGENDQWKLRLSR